MQDNEILEYLEDVMYFRRHDDKEGMEALLREGKEKSVTMKDVALTLIDIIDDLTDYIDTSVAASQALTEERLRAIVAAQNYDTRQRIVLSFNEAQDDLLNTESEEEEE